MGFVAAAPLVRNPLLGGGAKPNIIVLMADDLSARELGCYGSPDHATPNLDALAGDGVKVETCWATPICSPTRAEIMTGRYGFRTGWFHNSMKPSSDDPHHNLATSNRTFPQLLRRSGYVTAICGKWQLTGTIEEHAFDEHCLWQSYPGFDGSVETAIDGKQSGRAARYWHPAVVENGTPVPTTLDDYGPDIFTDFLLDFARRHSDGPFLVYYPMLLPHTAWDFERERETHLEVPEVSAAGDQLGIRRSGSLRSSVEYIDTLVGRIVLGLEQLGLRERTVVFFTSDNGSAGYGKNDTVRERGPRVPLIVNGPTRVAALGSLDALVDFSDILPTVVELADGVLPRSYKLDGRSFAPLLAGREAPQRECIFSCLGDRRFVRTRRWLLDGDKHFWDCGDRRDEANYVNVTRSDGPEVRAARRRFKEILERHPPPRRAVVRRAWRNNPCLSPRPITIKV